MWLDGVNKKVPGAQLRQHQCTHRLQKMKENACIFFMIASSFCRSHSRSLSHSVYERRRKKNENEHLYLDY